MSEPCALADSWLTALTGAGADDLPPNELVAHVSGCPRCRLALVALLAGGLELAAPTDQPCAAIEAQLPAFVDYEQAYGPPAAARTFTDLWWHLLVCADCAELYDALQPLAAMPAQAWAAAARPAFGAQIHPGVLRQLFAARGRLGAQYGRQQDDVLIAEQQGEIARFTVLLRHEGAAGLTIVVQTDPPIAGAAVLTLGETAYMIALDREGCAAFPGFDEARLSGGQQLTLKIQPFAI
jgi:hypothetical protein